MYISGQGARKGDRYQGDVKIGEGDPSYFQDTWQLRRRDTENGFDCLNSV